MKKRNYTKKQIAIIILLSALMLLAGVLLNQKDDNTVPTQSEPVSKAAVTATPPAVVEEDPTESIATFLQGPKSWGERREWSGKWGETIMDGGSFGGFGCGLCCMANIYTTLSPYECSPVDMYKRAKMKSGYEGGGAIDWGYMKDTLQSVGIASDVFRKPSKYTKFQKMIGEAECALVVVSSNDSDCYWKDTPGHYVTLFLYDEEKDKVFLGDSGDPNHNRHWVSLKKIYRSLKTSNNWQMLLVSGYDKKKDSWKHKGFGGTMVLPERWEKGAVSEP